MINRPFLLFLLFIALIMRSNGQIPHGGIPASFSFLKEGFMDIPYIEMGTGK